MVAKKRRLTALRKKLWRDMGRSASQFIAIVLLCALGTWVYSGLDGAWRMLQLSADTYFETYNLADYWVNVSAATKADVDSLANLDGVAAAQARFSAEMDAPDFGDGVSLMVHAYQGAPRINIPMLQTGETLLHSDTRGCLLEAQFADAHGLAVGDSLTLTVNGQEMAFVIRGTIISVEHTITAKEMMPDPEHYGFAVISWQAVSTLPWNEVLLTLAPGAPAAAVEAAVQAKLPEALVITRQTQGSTQRIRTDTKMYQNLTYVYPVLAFAVAAMIVLTTLTRMIENQRMQMGTLKALGYDRRQIRRHYLSYALVPSLVGSLLGLFIGRYTLPDFLYNVLSARYILPQKLRAPIAATAWGITALMVVLCVLICLYAYRKQARDVTAALLRPKPPKAGSRVLLEGWTSLWRRFSFNTKMVVRNIARSKGRTIVAMVGVLCCNMLIICGMGLQDSIQASIGDYYDRTVAYDLRADLDASAAGTLRGYQNRLQADRVEGVMEKSISLRFGGSARTVVLNVLSQNQQLLVLDEGTTAVPLPENGVAVSRKLAEVMGIAPGDTVQLWLPGEERGLSFTVETVYGVSIGQTVYMNADRWNSLHKGAFTPTALLLQNPTELTRHKLSEMDEVKELKDPAEQRVQSLSIMHSITAVFNLMYGAALGLAFVICYNMGRINFTEHVRDYATLKVLGYHQREIRRLMVRENNLVTLLGALLGIFPGIWLVAAVLSAVHSDQNVLIASVAWQTIVLSTVITCLFSMLIERLLTRKVRSIDMVEALKSVE